MIVKRLLYTILSAIVALSLIYIFTLWDTPQTNVTYRLDWHWGQAIPQKTEPGWHVSNDLGYDIFVKQGFVVTGNFQMIPCPKDLNDEPTGQQPTQWLEENFYPQPAYAGHGGEHDPSASSVVIVESLTTPTSIQLQRLSLAPEQYCQGHYLIAHAIETAENLPPEIDMIGTSLYIEGEYQAPDSDSKHPFIIKSDLAWGTLTDLTLENLDNQTEVSHIKTGDRPLTVTIRRDLSSIFDEVDFAQMPEQEQAKAVLRSLTEHTVLLVGP